VSPTTRRAALGALLTAALLTAGCGTRVESAAILAAEGHTAAAPAGDSGGVGGTITTTETAGAPRTPTPAKFSKRRGKGSLVPISAARGAAGARDLVRLRQNYDRAVCSMSNGVSGIEAS